MKEKLLDIRGVKTVHDLHAWSLTVGTTALSAHLAIGKSLQLISEYGFMLNDSPWAELRCLLK